MKRLIPIILFLIASVSVLTTFGIIGTLILETIIFFSRIPVLDFLFGTEWFPFANTEPLYGILPLIAGTLKVTFIAVIVAVPFGIGSAIFLSEYATDKIRRIIKANFRSISRYSNYCIWFFCINVCYSASSTNHP